MTGHLDSLEDNEPTKPARVVNLEERSWLPRHCQGDPSAFPVLLEAYRRPVYSYLVRFGISASERDDVFQTIFLRIHAAAESYQASRPLAPWLFTIVANTVRNHRRDRPAAETDEARDEAEATADPAPDPERIAQARETVAWLETAIAALPLAQREVLIMAGILEFPQQEVAEALDLPINTVKTNLRRARLALAKAIAERDKSAGGQGDSQ